MPPLLSGGTAFDGSPWVTALAASSLVIGTAASAVVGAAFVRRGLERGIISMEPMDNPNLSRRVKLLEKSSGVEMDMSRPTKPSALPSDDENESLESNATER
eukprot:CAMPEP_0117673176 /NCGR_PEP_ID=MMETSP0804-20121206/14329_1 /TAXON_ID=1074897 /ORGANISM="Tetraselmis astigmatica, Strain CCMP880" /LENGTH=101 /DNA_ID=CAMNT_0005481889 /DNA_START=148 /DNA_END=453 /DNA_ORIENTATION=+